MFIFDDDLWEQGELRVVHSIPYSDIRDASPATLQKYASEKEPVCFGHTLDDQIGGQIDAGFSLTGFYEDYWDDSVQDPLSKHIASFMATKATKD